MARLERVGAPLVLALALLVGAYAILAESRGLTFFYDEWEFVLKRFGWGPDTLLEPHNEHASLFPLLVFKTFLSTFGLGEYWPYRLAHTGLMALAAVLIYLYGRPRMGPWWALVPAVPLVIVGSAPEYVLWPFELSFTLSLLGVIGALLAVDASDWLASALLVVALFSSGVGLALFLAFVIETLLRSDRRRRAPRVLAAPALLYAAWWIPYHAGEYDLLDNLPHVPGYVWDEYVTAVETLTTAGDLATPIAILLALATVAAAFGPAGRRPRFWFVVAAPLGYWVSTALLRYGVTGPEAQRYAYPSAVLLALLLCELAQDRRLPSHRAVAAVAGAALAAIVVHNLDLITVRTLFTPTTLSPAVRREVGGLELARGFVRDPDFAPDPKRAPYVTARSYFAALDHYRGSAGDDADAIAASPPDLRSFADSVLFSAVDLQVAESERLPAACRPLTAGAFPGGVLFVDNRKGTRPAAVRLRRFAVESRDPLFVAPGKTGRIVLPERAGDEHPYFVRSAAPACAV